MNHISFRVIFVLYLIGISTLYAQKGTVSAGTDASGSGGSISYSIGQIDYLSAKGSGGKINQGIQVPYEIYVEVGIDNLDVDLLVSVYPNPSEGDVYLVISEWSGFQFKLFDLQGKLLMSSLITEQKTIIPLEKYSHSGYILNVIQDQKTSKTFRIIKKQ